MRIFFAVLLISFTAVSALAQTLSTGPTGQSALPERRLLSLQDLDLPGGDLRNIFDTTYQVCAATCLADPACQAFTFNARSNACFPKGTAGAPEVYAGAQSAQVVSTALEALNRAEVRAPDLRFLPAEDLTRARQLVENMGRRHSVGWVTKDQFFEALEDARRVGDDRNTFDIIGALLALGNGVGSGNNRPGDAALWAEYAHLALNISGKGSEVAPYRAVAVPAAITAYLHTQDDRARARSLEGVATALEQAGRGRAMIDALRFAQAIEPTLRRAAALDRAIATYGFRVTDTQVDSEAASPRICAIVSEDLQPGIQYTPFVNLPDAGLAVTAQDRQLCIEGVKHGQRYRFVLRAGLPAASGEVLHKDIELIQYVRDRTPLVRFPGRAYVLPKVGGAALPIETVNTTSVTLELRRVSDRNLLRAIQDRYFGRPLSAWQEQRFEAEIAETIWTGTGDVPQTLNQSVTTRLPMDDALRGQPAGIYALQARVPGQDIYQNAAATQWFVLSDLGLATASGVDGVHVMVRGLGDAAPRAGVVVQLISRANAVLGTAQTDAAGYAVFAPGLALGSGGAEPALITARDGDDLAFLSLTDPGFDLSDRGVEGRAPAGPVDVFLATDRGAYRAGEVIYATALARDGAAQAVVDLPVTGVLSRPDGVEYARAVSDTAQAGGHVFDFALGGGVPRGTWTLEILGDPQAAPLAQTQVLVEDFLPERIDFDLSLPAQVRQGAETLVGVDAQYLFGAPAADLPIEGEVTLRPATSLPGYVGYQFGLHDAPFDARTRSLGGGDKTDAQGQAQIAVALPQGQADQPLEAVFTLRISEGAARPVERRETRPVALSAPLIGIKPGFDGAVAEGAEAQFDLIALGLDSQPQNMALKWTLNRVETRYQWYQLYGNWNWEPVTTRTRIAAGESYAGDALALPVDWGRYELLVERDGGAYVASSLLFDAGYYAASDGSDTPDQLEVALDKSAYLPGETARLRLSPRGAGIGVIQVMSNRLVAMEMVQLDGAETIIELPVTEDWGAGAYVTATLIQPMDRDQGRNPTRALGLTYAAVDPGQKALPVVIETANQQQPRGPLEVEIQTGTTGPAYVTLAAVDVGILNLTAFQSPDPETHYFGQRRLGMELRDLYGRLIDGQNGAMGQVRSGGDALSQMQLQSPPPTEDLVTFFSGPIPVDATGKARVTLDIPDFNGTLRLMAVAWSATSVGSAETDVLIRDPIVMNASLPAFLAPGDEAELLLDITHAAGPTGRVGITVTGEGVTVANVAPEVTLAEGTQAQLRIPLTADTLGLGQITVQLTQPGGDVLEKTLKLQTLRNDPQTARTSRFTLADGATFQFDNAAFDGFVAGSGRASLALGPLAALDAPGLLSALNSYPYGCSEQITSQAMPLLYLSVVSEAMGLAGPAQIDARITQALDQLLSRQAANGSFGLWGVGSGDLWLDAYVSDFLSRAREGGYVVPDRAFDLAMDNLRNRVNFAAEFDKGGEDLAYALMVLAREGAASMGDLRYYADVKGAAFATPLAMAQIGAALASYGDPLRADQMFTRAQNLLAGRNSSADQQWRGDYGSKLRDTAGLLMLAAQAQSRAVDRAELTQRIASQTRTRSTQEAAWTLMAAQALMTQPGGSGFEIDGMPANGPLVRVIERPDQAHQIRNLTGDDTQITVTTFGVPDVAPPAGGTGYQITRQFYSTDGTPIILSGLQVGDRFVAVLTVTPLGTRSGRLMVVDPLPAGVAIDNPNLLRGGDISALEWLRPATAEHAEFRSDRFLAAVDQRGENSFDLAYIGRVTGAGNFHQPAAHVEDMYRPQLRAQTATGRVLFRR